MNNILNNLSYGLYAIGVYDNVRPTGCIVNTLFQVTSENPIVALSLHKNSYTYQIISRTKRFSAAILSEKSDPGIIKALGYVSGRDNNKFSKLSEYSIISELPVITGNTCGTLLCEVLQMQDAETHVVIIARVTDAIEGQEYNPMTYRYFQEVIKGRSPKNAPTYNPKSTSEEVVLPEKTESYVCKICGYVYNGDLNDEPDDYTCPICGVSKNDFMKQ